LLIHEKRKIAPAALFNGVNMVILTEKDQLLVTALQVSGASRLAIPGRAIRATTAM
jgi:hypothetical protein